MSADDWRDAANCATTDYELFFPESSDVRPAKKICAACDVRPECLAFALAGSIKHGVWGGMSSLERRKLGRTK